MINSDLLQLPESNVRLTVVRFLDRGLAKPIIWPTPKASIDGVDA